MGDLMRASEGLRWAGPPRYTLAGAATFLAGRAYDACIAYVPATMEQNKMAWSERVSCHAPCHICAGAATSQAALASAMPQGASGFGAQSHAAFGRGADVKLEVRQSGT